MSQKGFTLVEVLIASLIIFTAISISVLSFQTSSRAIESSEQMLRLIQPLPILSDEIENALQNVAIETHSAEGVILDVHYVWTAKPIRLVSPPARFNPDSGEFVNYPNRFALYEVRLQLRQEKKTKEFTYQKIGWDLLPAELREQSKLE